MIQPNELRIGNWIKIRRTPMQVVAIVNNDIKARHETQSKSITEYLSVDQVRPIELTEEILIESGFRFGVSREEAETCVMMSAITYWGDPTECWISNDDTIHINEDLDSVEIDGMPYFYPNSKLYVHQLQNLYFALKNKELNIVL